MESLVYRCIARYSWRRGAESNRREKVLLTLALPLGDRACDTDPILPVYEVAAGYALSPVAPIGTSLYYPLDFY